jgi:hypothetical protein
MFTGSRVVIRNKLDQETAKKYIVALKKRGAVCQIELMGQPGIAVNFDAISDIQSQKPVSQVVAEPSPNTEQRLNEETTNDEKAKAETLQKPLKTKAAMSVTGLPIVGDKVDEILRATHFDLAPVGVRLEEEKKTAEVELHALDNVSLAPVGSILREKKEDLPVSVPDTSHIHLAPKE